MSGPVLKVPGVYRQETRERAAPVLPTGVPVFVGLVASDAVAPPGAMVSAELYGPAPLYRKAEFTGGALAFLEDAITGFFDNGGAYCYVIGVKADPAHGTVAAAALIKALAHLGALADVDLVAVPDAVALRNPVSGDIDESLVVEVQRAVIRHCTEEGNRIALLDALEDKGAQAMVDDHVARLGVRSAGPTNAAIYRPWLRTIATGARFVPPCGHVAGIVSRTDAQAGVFKAPANTEILGATDLEDDLEPEKLALLNAAGVNCLRAFTGRGIRVWGARTLSPDPQWRYLNVRRLVLTVLRWVDMHMAWAAFEPNVPALWMRIQRELGAYLTRLWRVGALKGESVAEAFYIRCDAELNPPTTREAGQVVTEIGLAPTVPAEFIVVTLHHRAGTTELT